MSNQGRSAPFPQVKDRMAAAVLGLLLALVTIFGATALSNSHTPSKPIAFVDCNALRCGDG
jgi:hypothetical protein